MSTLQASRPEVMALLDAVKVNPEDDTPRLILADWLEEHGDPRGTFVRLECESARMPLEDPRRQELVHLARQLYDQHRREWLGPIAGVIQHTQSFRGLMTLSLNPGHFRGLNRATVWDSEAWAWVDSLSLSTAESDNAYLTVTSFTPDPEKARAMRLDESKMIVTVAGSPLLTTLTHLGIRSHGDGMATLLRSPHLRRLRRLNLSSTSLGPGDEAARALASSPVLKQLTHLNLMQTGLDDTGLHALGRSTNWGLLDSLDLMGNRFSASGLKSLVASSALDHLRTLNMESVSLQPAAAVALASTGRLIHLQQLFLNGNAIGDEGLRAIAESKFPALRLLHLRGNQIGDEGIIALARSASIQRLESLQLWQNRIGPLGAVALAGSVKFCSLTHLDLTENQLGDDGVIALAESPYLGELRELDLRRNEIGDEGGRALARSPYFPKLQMLSLYGSRFSPEVRRLLRERFGPRVWC